MSDLPVENENKSSSKLYPKLVKDGENEYRAEIPEGLQMNDLLGTETIDAAHGIFQTALHSLGQSAEKYGSMASAMFAELEPRDAIEAMLVAQMTATHVTISTLTERLTFQTSTEIRESLERSVTRLSRTFIAQMDALKKHRAKAQQTVRVERVTVNEGGQPIVGDVSGVGGG